MQHLLEEIKGSSQAACDSLAGMLRPGVGYLVSRSVTSNNVEHLTEGVLHFVVSSLQLGGATSVHELIRTTLDAVHAVSGSKAEQPAREVQVAADILTELAALPLRTRDVFYRCCSSGESDEEICSEMKLSPEEFRVLKAEGKAAIDRARKRKG
ncbi:MAG TPA: hypothetical protein VGL53_10190 [Bryobacteraceae bacterium]